MNRTQLPAPPDPRRYTDFTAWQRDAYDWMTRVKSRIETDSNVNTAPIGPLVVGTYTATRTVTGTDAISNFVATLVSDMNAKGLSAPNIQRITT